MTRRVRSPTEDAKREARIVLLALMRTPKTRPGLVAAVATLVGRRSVYGWITDWLRTGAIVKHKGSTGLLYMLPSAVPQISVKPSIYPSWLDPRTLCEASERRVFIAGRLLGSESGENEGEETLEDDDDDDEDAEQGESANNKIFHAAMVGL